MVLHLSSPNDRKYLYIKWNANIIPRLNDLFPIVEVPKRYPILAVYVTNPTIPHSTQPNSTRNAGRLRSAYVNQMPVMLNTTSECTPQENDNPKTENPDITAASRVNRMSPSAILVEAFQVTLLYTVHNYNMLIQQGRWTSPDF